MILHILIEGLILESVSPYVLPEDTIASITVFVVIVIVLDEQTDEAISRGIDSALH